MSTLNINMSKERRIYILKYLGRHTVIPIKDHATQDSLPQVSWKLDSSPGLRRISDCKYMGKDTIYNWGPNSLVHMFVKVSTQCNFKHYTLIHNYGNLHLWQHNNNHRVSRSLRKNKLVKDKIVDFTKE